MDTPGNKPGGLVQSPPVSGVRGSHELEPVPLTDAAVDQRHAFEVPQEIPEHPEIPRSVAPFLKLHETFAPPPQQAITLAAKEMPSPQQVRQALDQALVAPDSSAKSWFVLWLHRILRKVLRSK